MFIHEILSQGMGYFFTNIEPFLYPKVNNVWFLMRMAEVIQIKMLFESKLGKDRETIALLFSFSTQLTKVSFR